MYALVSFREMIPYLIMAGPVSWGIRGLGWYCGFGRTPLRPTYHIKRGNILAFRYDLHIVASGSIGWTSIFDGKRDYYADHIYMFLALLELINSVTF